MLHAWDDELCCKLLNNCHKALPENGKLIVAEEVVKVSPGHADPVESGEAMDMIMLGVTRGGRERSERQWRELLAGSGFRLTKIVGRAGNIVKIIEAVKF